MYDINTVAQAKLIVSFSSDILMPIPAPILSSTLQCCVYGNVSYESHVMLAHVQLSERNRSGLAP